MTSLKLIISLIFLLLCLPYQADNTALKSHPSPYIRSHSEDAINWKLINSNSIQASIQKNQPIIISSGYQSCYWCYRMKVDTFSNKQLARTINKSFLPLLIDRDLEPLLDKQLQDFMEEQRGFGGWPLTVILTPSGHPVVGFSYTNAESLEKSLSQFLRQWNKDSRRVSKLAQTSATSRYKEQQRRDQLLNNINYQTLLKQFLNQVSSASDDKFGGFGENEKFPNYPQLNSLLDLYSLNPDKALSEFIQLSLDNMLDGALRDQLAGGFFRYVEEQNWQAPHYEQMLYTQALMGKLLIRAGQTFNKKGYLIAGRDALLNMVNRFKDTNNGLYNSSLSALDNMNKAGGYYLWAPKELAKHLGKNWGQSIQNLIPNNDKLVLPKLLGTNVKEIRTLLLNERNKHSQAVDDKKIYAWQGLALSGLAYGSQLSPELNNAAKSLAGKIQQLIKQDELKELVDYAYVAQGLLDWWQISGNAQALESAKKLLNLAHNQHYKEGRWLQSNSYGFLEAPPTLALVDTQLPSPSAIWLSLSWALSGVNEADNNSALAEKANRVGKRLPKSIKDNAFFHASVISTLIAREWRLRNNLSNSKQEN